jgi:hypothetical protein
MGQQQLLLIILGTIVVSVATYTGLRIFEMYNQDQNRNRIQTELMHLYSLAEEYKMKPKSQGGGEGSYNGFQLTQSLIDEPDVWYWVGTFDQSLILYAYGTVKGNDGRNPVALYLFSPVGQEKMRIYVIN